MRLGTVLRKWRLMSELDLRSAAADMGLDAATLLRVEQGKTPSAHTLTTILFYLLSNNPKERQSL
jgi:transcriptional regulator with XRE-family HTH domain